MSLNVSSWRWLAAFVAGTVLWFVATIIAGTITAGLSGGAENVVGMALGLLGILRLALIVPFLEAALRIARSHLTSLGLFSNRWRTDVLLGLVVGVFWPLLQFLLLIPLTGGAEREDVIASRALIGDDVTGLIGVIILSWTLAAVGEELFFRGHIIHTLRNLFRGQRWGLAAAVAVSVLLFAVTHAYQGLIGIIDVGAFGLVMALLYLRRGSLTAPIVAHGVSNTLLFIGLFLLF